VPSDKYLRYGRPIRPADVNQEFMTVQETAFVLGCSVDTIHARLNELKLKSKIGRRVMTSKADRVRIHAAGRKPRRKTQPAELRAAA